MIMCSTDGSKTSSSQSSQVHTHLPVYVALENESSMVAWWGEEEMNKEGDKSR